MRVEETLLTAGDGIWRSENTLKNVYNTVQELRVMRQKTLFQFLSFRTYESGAETPVKERKAVKIKSKRTGEMSRLLHALINFRKTSNKKIFSHLYLTSYSSNLHTLQA